MAITFPRSLPNFNDIQSYTRRQRTIVAATVGAFSAIQQVQKHPGQWWEVEYVIIPLSRSNMDVWFAWLASLNGIEKTFYGVLQAPNNNKGTAANFTAPQVNGSNQTGNTLSIDAAEAGEVGYLKAGDFIQLGSGSDARLYMVLSDVTPNGSGEADLDIWPDLYQSPADNATITVSAPVGVFRRMENTLEVLHDNTNTEKGLRFTARSVI